MRRMVQVAGVLLMVGYAYVTWADVHFDSSERTQVPASARSSPGGYRSWSFWHAGSHGGK